MPRTVRVPFLANLYLYNPKRRFIEAEICIIGRKQERQETERKALLKMKSLGKKRGCYTALHRLEGLYTEGHVYCPCATSTDMKRTSRHEEFHVAVAAEGLSKKSMYPPLEESAAYAYETVATEYGGAEHTADWMRYCRLAHNSVRFRFALDGRGQDRLLEHSMTRLCENVREVIAGDRIAIASSSAVDFSFYLECFAVLKHCGVQDGKRILLDAVGVSDEKGADAGRKFLLEHLAVQTRQRIDASYGINLRGFSFRPLHSPKIEYDTWEW
jgi:hypothetical protein